MNENDLLAALPPLFATGDPSVLVGSGPDDCAHLLVDGRRLAVSVDAFAVGSHFLPDTPPEAVARKAMGASLSDLAASGCRARWAVVALGMGRGLPEGWAGDFARGLAVAAEAYGVTIVGGDSVTAPGGTFVTVTVMGEPLPGGPVLRAGARSGDVLVVTGALGGSILGKHLAPEPRLAEIRFLLEFARVRGVYPSAGMDISDGLALDLSRLCRESGVGAVVEAESLPLARAAHELAARDGRSALAHALTDGEDFELLLALPPRLWEEWQAYMRHPSGRSAIEGLASLTRIGTFTSGGGLLLQDAHGGTKPLAAEGYEHQW